MKTLNLSAVLLAAAVSGTAAFAQNAPTPGAPSSAPAPVVQNAAPVAINSYVYVEKLPTPTQLTTDAEAEHLTIARMDQSANRIVVVYQYPDGRTRAFAYTTVPPTANDQVVTAAPANGPTYTMVSPPPSQTVVYSQPASVVYYDSPRYVRYYDPAWDFWAPLAIGVGLGWGFGGHGHYYGGFHGGYHGHR